MSSALERAGLTETGVASAVLAHILLLVLLYVGMQWNETPPPEVIEVSLVAGDAPHTAPAKVRPTKALPVTPPPQSVAEPLTTPDAKIVVKTKPATSDTPPTPTAPGKPLKPKPTVKPIKEDLTHALDAEDADRLEREAAQALKDQQAAALKAERERKATLLASYQQKVSALVRQKILFEDEGLANLEAEFDVMLLPSRDVLDVKIKKSSGNPQYDQAVELAVRALKQFPPPPEGVKLERTNLFKFRLRD